MENVSTKYLIKKLSLNKSISEQKSLFAKIKLLYQLTIKSLNLKVDHHTGGKWFIHGPKHRKENQLLSMEHPCWLSLV